VRAKEHLGIATSETTADQFHFFVTPLMSQVRVENGAYVLIDHPVLGEACPVLAMVTEMKNYEEVVGTTIGENKSIRIMALGETIGYIDLRQPEIRPLRRLSVPLNPGSKVYLPYAAFLEDLFMRTFDGSRFHHAIHVGKLESYAHCGKNEFQQLNFYVDAEDFTEQHFLIAAISGAGKTHTAAVIVEELANKTDYPVVILDSYGEYTKIGLPGRRFEEQVHAGHVSPQEYPFDFNVVVYASDTARVKDDLERQGITRSEDSLSVLPVFEGASKNAEGELSRHLREGVHPNQVTVIDASGLTLAERQRLFSSCVKELWDSRVEQRIEPFLLVADEAEAIERRRLERIASEGRKRGCMMCLLSQHPTQIDGSILSQVSTHVVGRITEPRDLDYFSKLFFEPRRLSALRRGEWLVNGITQKHQTKVLVRERYSP
jgi:DNA helicase HerA-like ATPase